MPVPFLEATREQCQFIAGEPTFDALVCGEPVKPGSVYCPACHAICYRPTAPVRDVEFRDAPFSDFSDQRQLALPRYADAENDLTEVFA